MEGKLGLPTLLFAAIAVLIVASAVKPSDKAEYKVDSQGNGLRVLKFSWNNCGSKKDDPVSVKSFSLTPDPVEIPGNVTTDFTAEFRATVGKSSLTAVLVVKKKVFGVYIEIPCVDNFGSCTYKDICALIAKVQCPKPLIKQGIPCHCPFPKGNYTLPPTTINIPELPLPSFVENGDYEVKATIKSGKTRVACYDTMFSLKKA